jgi:hypothetical protein
VPWFTHEAPLITRPEIEALLDRMVAEAKKRLDSPELRRVLLLPPDITRAHAGVGWMTEYLYHQLTAAGSDVYVIPTLGQHVPHTPDDNAWMFGSVPAGEDPRARLEERRHERGHRARRVRA